MCECVVGKSEVGRRNGKNHPPLFFLLIEEPVGFPQTHVFSPKLPLAVMY